MLKSKVRKILIIVLAILLIATLVVGYLLVNNVFTKTVKTKKVEVVDNIGEYGYVLEEDSTKLYKDLYNNLKKVLNEKEVNEEEYAKLVAEMLVVDFYDLDSKMSKNDVGGAQFILDDYKQNFVLEAGETVYKYVEHNVYGDRDQDLPKVSNVEVSDVKKGPYIYNDYTDDNAYVVTVKVEYEKDLSYPSEVVVKMIHDDKILKVFYMK